MDQDQEAGSASAAGSGGPAGPVVASAGTKRKAKAAAKAAGAAKRKVAKPMAKGIKRKASENEVSDEEVDTEDEFPGVHIKQELNEQEGSALAAGSAGLAESTVDSDEEKVYFHAMIGRARLQASETAQMAKEDVNIAQQAAVDLQAPEGLPVSFGAEAAVAATSGASMPAEALAVVQSRVPLVVRQEPESDVGARFNA